MGIKEVEFPSNVCSGRVRSFECFGLSLPLNPMALFLGRGREHLNSRSMAFVCASMKSFADTSNVRGLSLIQGSASQSICLRFERRASNRIEA